MGYPRVSWMAFCLLSCAAPAVSEAPSEGTPKQELEERSVEVDIEEEFKVTQAILPHCLYGIDPHATGARVVRGSDGSSVGYRSYIHLFHALRFGGVKSGDTLVEVNGFKLGTPERWAKAWEGTRGATTCVWTLVRSNSSRNYRVLLTPTKARNYRVLLTPTKDEGAPVEKLEDGGVVLSREWAARRITTPYTERRRWLVEGEDSVKIRVSEPLLLELFVALGFEDSDLFVALNEAPFTNRSGMRYVLLGLLSDEVVNLSVERGGQRLTKRIAIRGDAIVFPILPNRQRGSRTSSPTTNPSEADTKSNEVMQPQRLTVTEYRRLVNHPEILAKQARFMLHRDMMGEFDGYRLSGIRRSSILTKMGLKNGDVVHGINTLPLRSMEDGLALLNELRQKPQPLRVFLTRRGKELLLRIDLDVDSSPEGGDGSD